MVIVDMSFARAQITERQRRIRRNAARRLARAQAEEQRAAEAAKRSREKAIEVWKAEEERLARQRAQAQRNTTENTQSPKRVVTFAGQVMVTEIPVQAEAKLPKAVSSPIGVSVCAGALSPTEPDDYTTPVMFLEGEFSSDDENDPEFSPTHATAANATEDLANQPRRIMPKRLASSFDESKQPQPGQRKKKSKRRAKRRRSDSELESLPDDNSDAANSNKNRKKLKVTGKGAHNDSDASQQMAASEKDAMQTGGNKADKAADSSANTGQASEQMKIDSDGSCANGKPAPNGVDNNEDDSSDGDDNIDDMFGDMVKKRALQKAEQTKMNGASKNAKKSKKSKSKSRDGQVRYTEDGLRIVSMDEIAKDQPEGLNGPCPFDCSCCF